MRGLERAVRSGALLAAAAAGVWALDNSVTLVERTGQPQSNRPTILSMWFAKGEFTAGHCAKPRVDGLDAVQWQCDPKVWWRDAETFPELVAAISNPNPAGRCVNSGTYPPCDTPYLRVTFANNFYDGETVRIFGSTSCPAINGTWHITDRDDAGFSIPLGTQTCTYTGDALLAGPANGSLRHGIISLKMDLGAGASHKVDFIGTPDYCHMGGAVACRSASLTKAQMLAFNESNAGAANGWNGLMELTAPVRAGSTGTLTANARTILSQWNGLESYCGVRYWLKGPVVTQVIVEDNCYPTAGNAPPYDMGWAWLDHTTIYTASGGVVSGASTTLPIAKGGAAEVDFATPVIARISISPSITTQNTPSANTLYEHVRLCGIDTSNAGFDLLIACTDGQGGRGFYNTPAKAWTAGTIVVSFFQGKNPVDDTQRNLHPMFVLTFPNGWPGVRVEYIIENAASNRVSGSWFGLTIRDGATASTIKYRTGLPVSSFATAPAVPFWMNVASRLRKTFWSGSDPEWYCAGGSGQDPCLTGERALRVRNGYNLTYMVAAGAVPPMDESLPIDLTDDLDTTTSESGKNLHYAWLGFRQSDRGEIGASRNHHAANGLPVFTACNCPETWRIMGLGVWCNRELYPGSGGNYPERDQQNGARQEEGGWLNHRTGLFLRTMAASDRMWEVIFGTSVPGGAGMAQVQSHMPNHYYESEKGGSDRGSRNFTRNVGSQQMAYGRPISLHVHPNGYYGFPYTGVSAFNADLVHATGAGASSGAASLKWTSWVTSIDRIGQDYAHQQNYVSKAYMITGDYYWLRDLQMWGLLAPAQVNPGTDSIPLFNNSTRAAGVRRHAHWGFFAPTGLIRTAALPMLHSIEALIWTPNEPQFGEASTPELHLLAAIIAKNNQVEEGRFNITNGKYPPPRTSSCVSYPNATTNDPWLWGRCDMGLGHTLLNRTNPLWMLSFGDPAANPEVDAAVASSQTNIYQFGYYYVGRYMMERAGWTHGTTLIREVAKYGVNAALNININPFLLASYYVPTLDRSTPFQPYQTFGDYFNAFRATAKVCTTFTCLSPNRVLPGNGYTYYWNGFLAMLDMMDVSDPVSIGCRPLEVPPNGCTAEAAYLAHRSRLNNFNAFGNFPKWFFAPRKIRDLVVNPGSTTATIAYRAPSGSARVRVSPFIHPTSDDSGDPSDGGTGGVNLTGLAPSTTYFVRITDSADPGTRQLFTFRTLTGGTDITPPARSNGAPSGQLPSGTTTALLTMSTDEPAICRLGPIPNTPFPQMPRVFDITGGASHTATVTGLVDGSSFSAFVRCIDGSNNANTTDFVITFDVAGSAGRRLRGFLRGGIQ